MKEGDVQVRKAEQNATDARNKIVDEMTKLTALGNEALTVLSDLHSVSKCAQGFIAKTH